ncbi:MAG: lipoyl synthase [Anaerosomatales bacterium]|nr:lipoyl synthase [Anaerosomatales bacterium]
MARYRHGETGATARLPEWMRRPIAREGSYETVKQLMERLELHTVCDSARCPNRGECYSSGTATFLVAGDVCTRGCRFCAVDGGAPAPLDPGEPAHIAEAVLAMRLKHAVVTMVTRDDLPDGGAAHVVAVISAIREVSPGTRVEVLVSDFGGDLGAVDAVSGAGPDVFNHNIETVPRLYGQVRPGAEYQRSLDVLAHVARSRAGMPLKSGLMVGLGETPAEVETVLRDLREAGCTLVTIGQYLRPGARHLPVAEFVSPETFDRYARLAEELGFTGVASAPFVRSSYHAGEMADGEASV